MIALDTNILLRYFLKDHEEQHMAASALFAASEENAFFISHIVLCEMVWVLTARYRLSRDEIAHILYYMLETREFIVENQPAVQSALHRYQHEKADFADFLIASSAHQHGCRAVATFDQKALQSDGFVRPDGIAS